MRRSPPVACSYAQNRALIDVPSRQGDTISAHDVRPIVVHFPVCHRQHSRILAHLPHALDANH